MSSPKRDWRYRLKGDPARWLLDDADNPSVAFWFQRDIVGRPEDSPSLLALREQILFSPPVQGLFAAQDQSGYWESPTSLDLPRYRATLWSLALLAELGIPRTSRHARAACEFVLQNHLNEDGAFTGLRELDYAGLLVRSLAYFRYGGDPRLVPVLERLAEVAATGNVFALWAFAELRDPQFATTAKLGIEKVMDAIANDDLPVHGAFPSFEPRDEYLALRVLKQINGLQGNQLNPRLEKLWEKQEEGGRWHLEEAFNGMLLTSPQAKDWESKWATLNALRIVTE